MLVSWTHKETILSLTLEYLVIEFALTNYYTFGANVLKCQDLNH